MEMQSAKNIQDNLEKEIQSCELIIARYEDFQSCGN